MVSYYLTEEASEKRIAALVSRLAKLIRAGGAMPRLDRFPKHIRQRILLAATNDDEPKRLER